MRKQNETKQRDDISVHMSIYSTVQYSTVQYSTVQYSTVQYSTVQYVPSVISGISTPLTTMASTSGSDKLTYS